MPEIGGHENGDGKMLVFRESGQLHGIDAASVIVKVAYDEHNERALRNEARILRHVEGFNGIAPMMYASISGANGVIEVPHDGTFALVQEDLGETEPVTLPSDEHRRTMVWLLARLREAAVRHGDLTGPNVIVRDGGRRLHAVDWCESHLFGEIAPQKSPWSDSLLAMRWIKGTADGDGGLDTPRVARRWEAILRDLDADQHHDNNPLPLQGKTFTDYGCFQGDFVALAAAEGMDARGIDRGGFRTGEDSIAIGAEIWRDFPVGRVSLINADARSVVAPSDVAMCFSMWPYMVQEFGRVEATSWLREAIANSGRFYFETQLHGDGPGPDFLPGLENVANLLNEAGGREVTMIASIPVTGRPALRAVWSIRGGLDPE